MEGTNEFLGTIKKDGELKASIQLVPNTATGKKRVEVYDPAGRLMAHQTLEEGCDNDTASGIAFALYNGFVFGAEYIKYKVRQNVESLLEE